MFKPFRIACVNLCLLLAACGGGGGSGTGPALTPITSFELIDPTPGAANLFGAAVIILANGNIVVTDPGDSSVVANSGAVHLYNPRTQTLIASIYGDTAGDQLGLSGVTALTNGNYVIASRFDDVNGVLDAGSVMLVNGTTGVQIGSTIAGDAASDQLGLSGVTALTNGNYVIASLFDDVNGETDAGSVKLVNGTTGVQIGSTIAGNANDLLGSGGVTALTNGNYVIASESDVVNGVVGAGSVMLVNGTTGVQIGSTIAGDTAGDQLGFSGATALTNGNYVIASPFDNVNGVANAGSVMLVNGTTGVQIGSTIAGNTAGDLLGLSVTALTNGNYVIASQVDDVNGVVNAGSVMLVNGTTGVQIGSTIAGDTASDELGGSGVTALANGNYVIASRLDDVNGVTDAGSVMLVNGTTGVQIGSTIAGDTANDQLGSQVVSSGVTALTNGNYAIASPNDDVNGVLNAGSVMLVNGTTGVQIGSTIAGDTSNDQLGSSVTALTNGNYVIVSELDDVNGVVNAGSVMLVNGTTGVQIGSTIAGNAVNDRLGFGGVTALANGNYVIASLLDAVNGVANAGSVMLVNGTTGVQIGSTIAGSVSNDMNIARVVGSASGDFIVLAFPSWDNNSAVDSGLVRLIAQ